MNKAPINQTSIGFMERKLYIADFGEKVFAYWEKWRYVCHLSFLRQTQMANQYDSVDQDDKRRVETSALLYGANVYKRYTSNFFFLSLFLPLKAFATQSF